MNSQISDYLIEEPEEEITPKEDVGVAVPKVSDYRERFKKRALTIDDLRPAKRANPIDKEPRYSDEEILLGPGVEEDWI